MNNNSYLDNPELDDTHRAHPAYVRGKGKGITAILSIVSDIMMGTDNGTGVNNNEDIESMRRALLVWRDIVNKSFEKTKKD
jgi:hypothetical protein